MTPVDPEQRPMYAAHQSRRCQHVRMNGMQCGSPALRDQRLCYFHYRLRRARKFDCNPAGIEDATSLHFVLTRLLHGVERNFYDPKTCVLMLRSLRLISSNLKQCILEQREDREEGGEFVTELPEGAEAEQAESGLEPPDPRRVLALLQERLKATREREQSSADAAPDPSKPGEPTS